MIKLCPIRVKHVFTLISAFLLGATNAETISYGDTAWPYRLKHAISLDSITYPEYSFKGLSKMQDDRFFIFYFQQKETLQVRRCFFSISEDGNYKVSVQEPIDLPSDVIGVCYHGGKDYFLLGNNLVVHYGLKNFRTCEFSEWYESIWSTERGVMVSRMYNFESDASLKICLVDSVGTLKLVHEEVDWEGRYSSPVFNRWMSVSNKFIFISRPFSHKIDRFDLNGEFKEHFILPSKEFDIPEKESITKLYNSYNLSQRKMFIVEVSKYLKTKHYIESIFADRTHLYACVWRPFSKDNVVEKRLLYKFDAMEPKLNFETDTILSDLETIHKSGYNLANIPPLLNLSNPFLFSQNCVISALEFDYFPEDEKDKGVYFSGMMQAMERESFSYSILVYR